MLLCRKVQKNILVIGPVYDVSKIDKILSLQDNYELIVINGSLLHTLDNLEEKLSAINKLNDKIIYNVSDLDYKSCINNKLESWIKYKNNITQITFNGGGTLLVVSGGVIPNMVKEDLRSNLEISFVSKIEGDSWHNRYNGMLGYIISNNPLDDSPPEYFQYSCRIGNTYKSNLVYAQEASQYGLQKTFLI